MSIRTDVLLWAQRVTSRATNTPAHVVLELPAEATLEQAQEAFHKIARTSHPDLHRSTLTPAELELVTTAYSRVAGAYQDFRTKRMVTTRMRTMKDDSTPPATATPSRSPSDKIPALAKPASGTPTESQSAPGAPGPMNSKALLYYRKAEMCLRKGDLKTAVLNMKMAIAGDPQSTFLRTALAEIELELAKK